jgi:hypothetical protein
MPRATQRRPKAILAWPAGCLVALHLFLGLGVDQFWPEVRDPEYLLLRDRLAARRAEAPGRPLVLLMGSSRTQMGLRADRLCGSVGGNAPLVFNFGVPGSGPMLQRVVLRRLLDDGLRPDLVFLEVMPMSLGLGGGVATEERFLDPARLDAAEATGLLPYYHQPHRLARQWVTARLVPTHRHQADLQAAIGLKAEAVTAREATARVINSHGWRPRPAPTSPDELESNLRFALDQYRETLGARQPASRSLRALRDLLALCRQEGIPAVIFFPPESSTFRNRSRAGRPAIESQLRRLAREFAVPIHDASSWVGDHGFWDGHHLSVIGAEQFTARFGREALDAALHRRAGLASRQRSR